MGVCKTQEFEVTEMVDDKIEEVIRILSNKSYAQAADMARQINSQHFFGNQVITVRSDSSSSENGLPEVSYNKEVRDKVISDKIRKDNYEETQQRIQELRDGNNYEFDDQVTPTSTDYNEFNYSSVISNKMLLKEKLEIQRDLIKNKGRSKEQLEQVEYLNEVIRKLYIDITKLQKSDETIEAYLDTVVNDIENIKELLKNPTLDNIQAINGYLEILDRITDSGPLGLLSEPLSIIKDKDLGVWTKLAAVHSNIALLQEETDTKIKDIVKDAIKFHLEQRQENSKWDDQQIRDEVERLYENQVRESVGKMGVMKAQFTMLDEQEERNILVSVIYKSYTDALATNNNKEKRKQLSNLKDKVLNELTRLGKTVGTGFSKRADQSVFLRESDTNHQLIGKFSENWVNFTRKAKNTQEKISKILYKGDKTEAEQKEIDDQFKELEENVDFIDVTRIPEIMDDKDFGHYSNSYMDRAEADKYRQELIDKVGLREYNKAVQQQKENIYAYQIFKDVREARLRDKFDIPDNADLQDNIPEKDWNTHLHFLYSKSPFIFSENYRNKGNNIITKPYYVKGEKFVSENTSADMEYISYVPKQTKYFDSNFAEIESNTILNEAWEHIADLVEYNNKNGFTKDPDSLTEYSLASQEKRIKSFPIRMLSALTGGALKTIHDGLTVSQYKDPDAKHNVAGQITNVDQEIGALYHMKVKAYKDPSDSVKKNLLKEAKDTVMARQDSDLIDNILASTEVTEVFKAKREIENKINFLRKHLESATDRTRFQELVKFFADKELYQINNRANFNRLGKDFSFSNTKGLAWTKFYNEKETELRDAAKESLKALNEFKEAAILESEKAEIQEEIDAVNAFLDSGGKVMTPGSLLEGVVIKMSRIAAFSLNFKAQVTNMAIASLNAREVDGRLGFWDAGTYHDAVSFSRKWRMVGGSQETKKQIKTGELLLQRLQLFQNSANEIFKLEKSRAATVFGSIMENPMNFVSEVEKTIQRPQIFALVSKIEVAHENGTKVPMFNPKDRSFPAFQFDSEGNLEMAPGYDTQDNRDTFITNTSQEYANLFGDSGRVPKSIAYINGDYRSTSTYLFEKNTMTAMMMLFKRWAVETVRKKFGVLKRLGENEHAGLGNNALALTGLTYSFATGAVFGPIGLGVGLAMYTTYHGYKTVKHGLDNDLTLAQNAMKAITNIRFNPIQKAFVGNIHLSMAVAAQTLGMIIDPFTKKQIINSDHIKRLIKLKDKSRGGKEFTPDQVREIKEDIYFLTTSMASTLKFLALRSLIMMALYPGEDEEEKHKERVKNKDKFWTRLYQDPDTAIYYTLENMLSGFIGDSNMFFDTDGLVRDGDIMGLAKFGTYGDNIEDWVKGEGNYKSGENVGENKLLTNFLRYNTPAVLKDGLSLGFGSSSKKDYDAQNYIDQVKVPILEKVNKARLDARKIRKRELENRSLYQKLDKKTRDSEIGKILLEEYPVINPADLNSKGNLRRDRKDKYKKYWKD
jgi:hypothetical protein